MNHDCNQWSTSVYHTVTRCQGCSISAEAAIKGHDVMSTTSLCLLSHSHSLSGNPERRHGGQQQCPVCRYLLNLKPPVSPTFTTDDNWNRMRVWCEHCVMPVIQCIACHLSPSSLLQNLRLYTTQYMLSPGLLPVLLRYKRVDDFGTVFGPFWYTMKSDNKGSKLCERQQCVWSWHTISNKRTKCLVDKNYYIQFGELKKHMEITSFSSAIFF